MYPDRMFVHRARHYAECQAGATERWMLQLVMGKDF